MAIYPFGTAVAGAYSLVMATYSIFGFPNSEFAATEAADIGSLGVNLFYSARPDDTEGWKIRKIIEDKVYPHVYFYAEIHNNDDYGVIIVDFPE